MIDFKGKRVLVAGGAGMIGIPLVEILIEKGAKVRIADIKPGKAKAGVEFYNADLRKFSDCQDAVYNMDYVFNLLCKKGSHTVLAAKPASIVTPTLLFNSNLIEAACQEGIKDYFYASSIGVYPPAEVFFEDDADKGLTSPNDRFAGWAKRVGEVQCEAYKIQYDMEITIGRISNTYGAFDNFERENALVIPSLIRRAMDGDNPLTVWGDGSQIRDFIHAEDAARGILTVAEKGRGQTVNIGSGKGVSIRRIAELVALNTGNPKLIFDTSKPSGDAIRVMKTGRAQALGFEPKISIEKGIAETIQWYKNVAR